MTWVEAADLVGPIGPAGAINRGAIPANSNINTWRDQSKEGFWTFSGSGGASLTGLPSGVTSGSLLVMPGLGGHIVTSYDQAEPAIYWRGYTNLSSGLSSWQNLNSSRTVKNLGLIPAGTNLNFWHLDTTAGEYTVNSVTAAQEIVNWPTVKGGTPQPGKLTNNPVGISTQMVQLYGGSGQAPALMFRAITSVTTKAWSEWIDLTAGGGGGGGDEVGLKHAVRVDTARKRLGYKIGTGGKAVVMLQFDDYNAVFGRKVLPILREFDLPATMALAVNWVEGNVTHPLNETVPWPTVQGWVLNDGIRAQGHSWTHSQASSSAQLRKEIVESADYMETNMPRVAIDGWSMPGTGVSTDPYGGYNGSSVEDFTETEAGKLLMSRYAFVSARKSGYFQPGGATDLIGQSHGVGETSTVAEFKAAVEDAIAGGYALATMHHPGFLDTEGYKTTAQLRECLRWLAEQRNLGRLMILTREAANVLDPSTSYRQDLLPGTFGGNLRGWSGWALNSAGNPSTANTTPLARTVDLTTIGWARGGTREFHATVRATTETVVQMGVTSSDLNATKRHTIPANTWVEIRSFFTVPLVGTSTLNLSISRVSGGTVQIHEANAYAA